jgi:large subunit ribosomal protein L9
VAEAEETEVRVILLDDVAGLGEAGVVVEVKNGYGRNFLLPRRLAEMATRDALNRVELIRRAAEAKRARRMAEAAAKYSTLEGKTLVLTMRAGTQSRIFGAVTSSLIAEEVQKQFGMELDRRHIMLDEPIKHLGDYTVPLRASADVTGEIRVSVEAEAKQRGTRAARAAVSAAPKKEKARAPAGEDVAPAGEHKASGEVQEAAKAADALEKYEHAEEDLRP